MALCFLVVSWAMVALPGCYYGHLAVGQARLFWSSRPIHAVLEDDETSRELRSKLLLVQAATRYAADLGLEVDGQYTSYLAWPGDRIVTTVVATRPAEVEPAGFRFPLLGTLPYKGFFAEHRAEALAEELRAEGLDVCVSGVAVYSTLGWFDDPITEPMLATQDGNVVETIVHELVHATVYARDEPEFNESIATFIGQEAAILFFAEAGPSESARAQAERARVQDARRLAAVLEEFRSEVIALYAGAAPDIDTSAERAAIELRLRGRLSQIQLAASTPEETQRLAERVRLNDACLALRGTYTADLERHAEVLDALGGDLRKLVERLRVSAENRDPRGEFFKLLEPTPPLAGSEQNRQLALLGHRQIEDTCRQNPLK